MANEDSEKVEHYPFLSDRKMAKYFARIDYFLRNGVHIQREYPYPSDLYRFLDANYENGIKDYYLDIFELPLRKSGNEFNQYYFIDLNIGDRSKVSSDYKDYLKSPHILVGLLFLKIYRIDGNIELDNINEFTSLLFQEYEEEKLALTKLITDTASEKSSDRNEEKVEAIIEKAFEKFGELGWLLWDDSKEKKRFKVLPSFDRLREMYQFQIDNIDSLIMTYKDEK